MITRRELLQYTAATAAVAAVGHATGAERQAADTPLFPGFKTAKIKTSGATINLVSGAATSTRIIPSAPWRWTWSKRCTSWASKDSLSSATTAAGGWRTGSRSITRTR